MEGYQDIEVIYWKKLFKKSPSTKYLQSNHYIFSKHFSKYSSLSFTEHKMKRLPNTVKPLMTKKIGSEIKICV